MRMRKLGALEVSEIGFGILSFTSTYGQSPDKAESIRVIRGAHDLGITLFDTAEAYGPWTNEALVGEALAPVRNEVVIATKFGFDVDPATGERRGLNSQPEHIKRATDAMLRRLGTNHIDLLYQHRVDPNVPIEDVAGAVRDLIAAGKVRHFGHSRLTHSSFNRRKLGTGRYAKSCFTSDRFGKRCISPRIASCASIRARCAPRHRCLLPPND